ncbi:MAG: (2Fe-2S)-binding protein [Sedimentisphaerales bacterium]|nr:(2Fe-2S)-binding protein [Sedimentisphaerales bacterium]
MAKKKVTFTFNGHPIEAEEGLSVLQAVLDAGYTIPHYCYHEGLSVAGSCRLCAVEVGHPDKDGNLKMIQPLVMSCQTPVRQDMTVRSDTERVRDHQKSVLELLLINHPLDCPVCDQAGECLLQDYSFRYGRSISRFETDDKIKQPKKDVGKYLLLYSDRCILCTRCVRFTREVSGTAELAVVHRGNKSEIDIFGGRGIDNKLSGNLADICPVGALLAKPFLFKQRVWFLENTPSVCPRCSRGCNIYLCHNQGVVWRLLPRRNDRINGQWICDEGRFGSAFLHADERLSECRLRRERIQQPASLAEALQRVGEHLAGGQPAADKLAVVLSPFACLEEQYLLSRWARGLSAQATLVSGPVFSADQDETFPGGFVIAAEKAPNRRGMQRVLDHFGGPRLIWQQLEQAIESGAAETVWVQGGHPWRHWCTGEQLALFRQAKFLIAQDILDSELTRQADVVFAGAAWAEKAGTFINDQDLAQSYQAAIEPAGAAVDDTELLWRLGQGDLPFDRQRLQAEIADALGIKGSTETESK